MSVTATPTVTTTYELSASNNCGSSVENIDIIVLPTPATPLITQSGNELSVVLNSGETANWYLDSNQIGIGNQITITENGSYTIIITNNNGCSSQISETFTVTSSAITSQKTSSIKIYPNPTKGIINISWTNNNEVKKIQIYDMIGQEISHHTIQKDHQKIIDLSRFVNGIYTLRITTTRKPLVRKVIKN